MADKLLQLDIVAPDHQALSVEASSVVVRSPEGELGFLPNHIALISALVPQIVRYKDADGREDRIFVAGGLSKSTIIMWSFSHRQPKKLKKLTLNVLVVQKNVLANA